MNACRQVPIGTIHQRPGNARRHPRRNVEAVKESLRRFGQQRPILVGGDGAILAGSVVWQAANELGWTTICVQQSALADAEAAAFALADNRTAELAEWDDAILAEALTALTAVDEALATATGFSPRDIEHITARAAGITEQADLDTPPDPPVTPRSRPGAIYCLGRHRLLVGDATRAEDVIRLMAKSRAHLLLTDPPYNVAYEGRTADRMTIANDALSSREFLAFLTAAFRAADRGLRPGAAFYIWHADSEGHTFREACVAAGWPVRQCLIWAKPTAVLGHHDYHWQHEPCLYGWKPGGPHQWHGDRKQTTVQHARDGAPFAAVLDGVAVSVDGNTYVITGQNLTIAKTETTLLCCARPARNADHPTMKPVALFERLLLNSTERRQAVLDPFAGSGTTVLACERTGRRAYCIEIDARYADVIRRRWAEAVFGLGCDWTSHTPEATMEGCVVAEQESSTPTNTDERAPGDHPSLTS